jgi:hypothetical protein
MKLLELYFNKNGEHKFVIADGTRRTEFCSANGDNNAMLSQALTLIQANPDFESRLRIYDCNGIMLKGSVTRYASTEELRSWEGQRQSSKV